MLKMSPSRPASSSSLHLLGDGVGIADDELTVHPNLQIGRQVVDLGAAEAGGELGLRLVHGAAEDERAQTGAADLLRVAAEGGAVARRARP